MYGWWILGSFGGGVVATLSGSGFSPKHSRVKFTCDGGATLHKCYVNTTDSGSTSLSCVVPPMDACKYDLSRCVKTVEILGMNCGVLYVVIPAFM